jgi:serine/threonine protein kinase HipA of HipAB toxin-antitoxin module
VPGPRRHWAATCEVLEARRRLPAGSAAQVLALRQFGRLIGNTDMHFGNLGLWVEREQLFAGRFRVAPLYDMLPMRWRPDASSGEMSLLPFEPDTADLASAARPLAAGYWDRVAQSPSIGRGFRKLAGDQARRCRASAG